MELGSPRCTETLTTGWLYSNSSESKARSVKIPHDFVIEGDFVADLGLCGCVGVRVGVCVRCVDFFIIKKNHWFLCSAVLKEMNITTTATVLILSYAFCFLSLLSFPR